MTQNQSKQGGPGGLGPRASKAYQWAMEAVAAIPIAGGLGYWVDSEFETGPIGLVVGLGFGFATFVVRLLRMRSLFEPEPGPKDDEGSGRP